MTKYPVLAIGLFGAPQVTLGENPVTGFVTRKAEALFYYLVVTGRVHTRDALAALFWPDTLDSRAKKNLRDLLFNLRQVLGDYLLITRSTVAFAQERPYLLDVEQLRIHLKDMAPTIGLEALHTVVSLYQGEFLEGFFVRDAGPFEEWMLLEREQLHELYLHALSLLIDYHVTHGEYNAALPFTQKLLGLQPWHEQAHRQQMLCLAHTGRLREALAQYELCHQLLASELALAPSTETVQLYEQLRAGKLPQLNATASASAPVVRRMASPSPLVYQPPHNLPRQLTPFFGRSIEITQVATKLLQPDCAWVTLAGEGGIGKSRLALKVAREVLPYFRDGVWLVGLADLNLGREPGEVLAAAIGQMLQLSFVRGEALLAQLIRLLRERQLLLIVDNFELAEQAGAAFIHQLLQATQQVKVLLISRHRLNYQAENLFVVDLLPVPDEDEAISLPIDELLAYAAIALFVHRAAQVQFNFILTEENAPAVAQICRLAQGLPLAIEMAATLVQWHTCEQIVELLLQNVHRLRVNFHDLPTRHHSLQATLSYSWQFLPEAESLVLAQCALFLNSFTAAAAVAVTGVTPMQLQRWEHQALLQTVTSGRYEMHALMRDYALAQIAKSPAVAAAARDRHARYFMELLQSTDLESSGNARAIDALRTELSNICHSWDWLLQQQAYSSLASALPRLVWLFTSSGAHQTAVDLFQRSIEQLQQGTPDSISLLAQVLLEQAYFYTSTARLADAKGLIQEALGLAQQLKDVLLTMTAYWRLGDIAWAQGDYTAHRVAYEQALALAQANGRSQSEVHCLSNLGMNYDLRSEYKRAIRCYAAALSLTRQLGDAATENVIYNNLGVSSILLEDFMSAFRYYSESLELSRRLGDQEGSGFANLNFGLLYNTLGVWNKARWHGERALKIFRMIGDRRLEARSLIQLGQTLHATGESIAAASNCQQALQIARLHGYQAVEAEALTVWGQLLLARQQYVQATATYREALALWEKLGRIQRMLVAQSGLIDSLRLSGELSASMTVVETVLAVELIHASIKPPATLLTEDDPVELGLRSTPVIASQVWLACYQTLAAYGDSRAPSLLQHAQQLLYAKVAQISDEQLRDSFLHQIPAHHQLLALPSRAN